MSTDEPVKREANDDEQALIELAFERIVPELTIGLDQGMAPRSGTGRDVASCRTESTVEIAGRLRVVTLTVEVRNAEAAH